MQLVGTHICIGEKQVADWHIAAIDGQLGQHQTVGPDGQPLLVKGLLGMARRLAGRDREVARLLDRRGRESRHLDRRSREAARLLGGRDCRDLNYIRRAGDPLARSCSLSLSFAVLRFHSNLLLSIRSWSITLSSPENQPFLPLLRSHPPVIELGERNTSR